ncbi:DNA alkylation repair protein [Bacillus sp. H-16]|uniref:DNA alkylation repair protein n=1 Tax=Alteribacter salitolerans TaxID=2912333 RepID=UPI001964D238|nr:DNA alkylation repair protein [Alteribacter salitolerans]MBM7095511.1 DNA alkylation repair protein [Alteribacter salitolerans]
MSEQVSKLKALFDENKNAANTGPMEAYMKHHFPFLGIKAPERTRLTRQFLNETAIHKGKTLPVSFLKELWALPEREYHYTAIEITARMHKVYEKEHLPFFEELIVTNSWWDSVDGLAPNVLGPYFKAYPDRLHHADKWALHENMWLRRTAILYQLKEKEQTDEERLFRYCRKNAQDPEFFIRKAIGWALREYSKTKPGPVENFIDKESLSNLSKREGLKQIQRVKKECSW